MSLRKFIHDTKRFFYINLILDHSFISLNFIYLYYITSSRMRTYLKRETLKHIKENIESSKREYLSILLDIIFR